MFTAMSRILSILIAALAIVVFIEPVWAQVPPSSGLEEIVVTARKRNENFQDVPITVDVFTAQEIKAAGIERPRDFIAMVPNMTLVETQNVGNSFVTIRGISQARNSEPSVAVLVDGVLETNPYEFTTGLYDIRQIEVLKGPQGALYGRDAIGGAIIIHTADPTDHFEANTMVGLGNGPSQKAQLAVERPDRFGRDAAIPRRLQLLQYRRLFGEHLPRPQGRPVPRLLGQAAPPVDALG